jgi:hypothetical protein
METGIIKNPAGGRKTDRRGPEDRSEYQGHNHFTIVDAPCKGLGWKRIAVAS